MGDTFDRLSNLIILLGTVISSLINITIIRIHIKQRLLKDGFFHVVFGQVITELIINVSLFFLNFIYLISATSTPGKWLFIFPIIFNFGYIANIIYNTRIILFLMTFNNDREELINYATPGKNTDESRKSFTTRSGSVLLIGISFKNFHIIAVVISAIHTILYIINLEVFQNVEIQGPGWHWYFYFICGKDYFYRIFFFIFHFLFFFISIPYMYFSCDKNKISNHIYLRSYSIFCFFSSIVTLFFPVVLFIFMWGYNNDDEKFESNYLALLLLAFLIFLLSSSFFRINCYYVNFVLVQDGKSCINRWCNAIKILLCLKEMKKLNFVDFNSAFIYHALASADDFILDDGVDANNEMSMFSNDQIEIKDNIEDN